MIKGTELLELMKKRYSGRSYDSSKFVTQEQIDMLVEAARHTPSCFNDQPWRYIICNKQKNTYSWNNAFDCLTEKNRLWVVNCPVVIICCYATKWYSSNRVGENHWGSYDTGAASYALVLQAFAMGMMAHEMGGFDYDKIIKNFNIPQEFKPIAVIAVGYEQTDIEIPQKKRLLKEELFFYDKWKI